MRMRLGKPCVKVRGCALAQSLKQFQHPYSNLTPAVGSPGGETLLPSAVLTRSPPLTWHKRSCRHCEVACLFSPPDFHTHNIQLMH